MGAWSRAGLALAVVMVVTPLASPVAASAATSVTDVGQAQVVDLPSGLRAQPRGVFLAGRTDDGHLVFDRERDPWGPYPGLSDPVMVAPDGSSAVLDERVRRVVGNRLVQAVASWSTPVTVISRLVDDATWSTLTVPGGDSYLGYTSDGVLVVTGEPGARQLAVLPWDGSASFPVGGLPADGDAWSFVDPVGSGALTLVSASSSPTSAGFAMVVDTTRRQAWPIDPGGSPCGQYGRGWSVNAGVVAWQGADASEHPVICTAALPGPGGDAVGPTTSRPWVSLGPGLDASAYQLTPVGDTVVESIWNGSNPAWGTSDLPIVAVAPDGSTRQLTQWGYGAVPGPTGKLIAVTGTAPGEEAVSAIDVATGSAEVVLPVDPVLSWYAGIAVDGDRVVYTDDSANQGAVRQRIVDFAGATVSASTLLDTDAVGAVTAGAGATAWAKSGTGGTYSGHLDSDGNLTHGTRADVTGTDERWVLYGDLSVGDTTTGALRPALDQWGQASILDGVTYTAGAAIAGGPAGSVVARDLVTGEAEALPVEGCAHVYGVQAAGSWLLVPCMDTTGHNTAAVVDRTGATGTWRITDADDLFLGNGFVVARASDGSLSWSPLSGGAASWQPLGTAPSDAGHVAASRGEVPTVAWSSGRSAHVALVPVATSPLPAHPAGVRAPTAPVVTVVPVNGALRVSWAQPPAADQVRRFVVSASSATGASPSGTETAGDATSTLLVGATNGASYDVEVRAWNIAGTAVSAPVQATPLLPPPAPTNLQAHVEPATNIATVTWDFASAPGTEALTSFSLFTGLPDPPTGLPPQTRSVTFPVPDGWRGAVYVYARGPNQQSASYLDGVGVPLPPPDTTPPAADLDVPTVTLTNSVSVVLRASDDHPLPAGSLDVRWRTGHVGQRLNAYWVYPGEWQARDPGRLEVSGLHDAQTACFSVRARDAAGNTSGWSPEHCVATAIDDRALSRSSGVRRITGAGYFRHTATRLGDRSTWVGYTTLRSNTGWLVATTCPTCGRVRIMVGKVSYGSLSLRSSKTQPSRLIPLPFPSASGKLRLMPTRKDRRVVIDALVLEAH